MSRFGFRFLRNEQRRSEGIMTSALDTVDAVVVGAGFGGLHALYRLRSNGLRVLCIESADDVGGAWYWNRYPGARCDVESFVYSYSFSPELDAQWKWSEQYSAQPEIKAYLQFAADCLGLRKNILFSTRVIGVVFDTNTDTWAITTDSGDTIVARFVLMATGPLSEPIYPDIPGLDEFSGQLLHSARWVDPTPELTGKKVGVIGTGSSGVQIIPLVAQEAQKLTVFVRTPNFTVPARNRELTEDDYEFWEKYRDQRRAEMISGAVGGGGDLRMDDELRSTRSRSGLEFSPDKRREILERRWAAGGAAPIQGAFNDVMRNRAINDEVADFVREKIREVVKDPATAEILTPRGFCLGAKRTCVGTDYYETFNRENVEAVDVKVKPIERITPHGVLVDGTEIELDVLILATGFDALTGAFNHMEVKGSEGLSLHEAWEEGPKTYLGLMVRGFPNIFFIGAPGSPSVFSDVVLTNEMQTEFIAELLAHVEEIGATRVGTTQEAQNRWTALVNEIVEHTLFATADSWYVGANVPGKPRVILAYVGGIASYKTELEAARDRAYDGFVFS
jgi:cyclohexanone monooxygenase